MKYSVIIPTLTKDDEHYKVLMDCIESVQKTMPEESELIIVNDGSLVPYPGQAYADVWVHHKTNQGIAVSWNDGIRLARGEYIVIINDDITVKKGWLEALKNALAFPKAMVAAPGVEGKENYHGIEANYKWFPGYCFMLKRETVEKVGLFDEQFSPFNYEDTDYWMRVLKAGGQLMRNYSTTIIHHEGHVLHTLKYDEVSETNKKKFINKWGFDPIPYFYYEKDIEEVL